MYAFRYQLLKSKAMFVQVVKVVIAGILGGILLFEVPFFLFSILFFFLLIGLVFRLFAGKFYGFRRRRPYYPEFEDQQRFRPYENKERLSDYFNENPKSI